MAKQILRDNTEDDIKKAFAVFDKENNGFIDAATLRHYLVSVGEILTQEEADKMIKKCDPHSSGKIQCESLVSMLMVRAQ